MSLFYCASRNWRSLNCFHFREQWRNLKGESVVSLSVENANLNLNNNHSIVINFKDPCVLIINNSFLKPRKRNWFQSIYNTENRRWWPFKTFYWPAKSFDHFRAKLLTFDTMKMSNVSWRSVKLLHATVEHVWHLWVKPRDTFLLYCCNIQAVRLKVTFKHKFVAKSTKLSNSIGHLV